MVVRVQRDEVDLLLGALQRARESIVWKLDSLSEYDARRPMTPTGTNLLGLVKHMTGVEQEYLRECMGLERLVDTSWVSNDAPDNSDMWATLDEPLVGMVQLYRDVWAADDAAVRELGLDAIGRVPWWGAEGRAVTVRELLIHLIAETHRHAGHADIVRERIDGAAGLREAGSNLPQHDPEWWSNYVEGLERVARASAPQGSA